MSDHLADIAEKEARCKWHMPRGLKYALWEDGLRKAESDPHVKRLKGVIGIEIPDEDWDRYWEKEADLRGRCRVVLQEVKVTKLSIVG